MTLAATTSMTRKRGSRLPVIDIVRGAAILAMIVYHLAWDLSVHHLVAIDIADDPLWKSFARLIAGTFLFLVGVNLVLAARSGFRVAPYLRRLAMIVAAAALVSLGTWWFIPDAFVFFGILHEIAVASVLALPFLWAPSLVTAAAGLFFIAGPHFLASPFFDAPEWLWLGLSTGLPSTVDYVPLFPWFGVVLFGVVAGRWIAGHDIGPFWHARPVRAPGRFLAFCGRWSLLIYLVHQPVLLGLLFVVAPLVGPSDDVLSRRFMNECDASCAAAGYDKPSCDAYCGCRLSLLEKEEGILGAAELGEMTEPQRNLMLGNEDLCRSLHLPPITPGAT